MITKTTYLLFIGVLLIIIASGSCKKIENKERKLYGRMIDSVTVQPIKNTSFLLFSHVSAKSPVNGKTSYDEYSFSTDADGSFSVSFRSENGRLEVYYPGEEPESGMMPVWQESIGSELNYNAGEIRTRGQ